MITESRTQKKLNPLKRQKKEQNAFSFSS